MEKKEENNQKEKISSTSLIERLAFDTTAELIKDADKIDRLRSYTEEEIEKIVIEDEFNLKAKLAERLFVAAHLILLPEFFYEYYADFDKIPHALQMEIKEILRTIFTCFSKSSPKATKAILPFLNLIDNETLTKQQINLVKKEMAKNIINWLVTEFYQAEKSKLLSALEEILVGLTQGFELPVRYVRYEESFSYLNNIKRSYWLPVETKVCLIEKIKKLRKGQIILLNRILSQEDRYHRKNISEIRTNFFIFTKALKLVIS